MNEIVCGKRGITLDIAWLLADALGTTPEFWMNLQVNYDLVHYQPKRQVVCIATAA